MEAGDQFKHEFTITPDIYKGFLDIFKDLNPLHTNKSFAISKGFKDVVMHGNILNGFVSFFIGELLPDKNVIIMRQEIKYPLPVYMNDTLSFQAKLTEKFDSVSALEFKFDFKNRDSNTVAKGKILIGII